MKGYILSDEKTLTEREINNQDTNLSVKVRITKSLLTLSDSLRYNGTIETKNVALGSFGIGIVTDTKENAPMDIEKGANVYILPYRTCNECYNCKNEEYDKCSNLLIAGEDYNGFLCDFVQVNHDMLYVLPNNVSEIEALFIGEISLAVSIIDKLNIQKGEYITIVGTTNLQIILAQLLIYYQAVPIVLTNDEEDYQIAKNSGIYYVLGPDDNWQKEVNSITSGRMTDKIVYSTDTDIPVIKAFSISAFNSKIIFTGSSNKSNQLSFYQATKKQLNIICLNTSTGNTETAINLIANKAIDVSQLKLNQTKFENVPKILDEMEQHLKENGKIHETIVDML